MKKDKLIAIAIIFLGIYYRLIPHPPNFSPLIPISVFSGTILSRKINKMLSFLLPIFILFTTDIFLGFHKTMFFVYLSFLISSLSSYYIDKFLKLIDYKKITKTLISSNILSLINTILFFLISNLGVFLTTNLYSKDLNGLLLCYFMALPFLKNSILSSFIFTTLIFSLVPLLREDKLEVVENRQVGGRGS